LEIYQFKNIPSSLPLLFPSYIYIYMFPYGFSIVHPCAFFMFMCMLGENNKTIIRKKKWGSYEGKKKLKNNGKGDEVYWY
jgi:hypothetical protein